MSEKQESARVECIQRNGRDFISKESLLDALRQQADRLNRNDAEVIRRLALQIATMKNAKD